MTFGELIKELLLSNCQDLATRLGVAYPTANIWMNGHGGMKAAHRRAFVEAYAKELKDASVGVREIPWPESASQDGSQNYAVQVRNPNDHAIEVRVGQKMVQIPALGAVDHTFTATTGVRIRPLLQPKDKPVLVRISVV